jgi:hypothetical protein
VSIESLSGAKIRELVSLLHLCKPEEASGIPPKCFFFVTLFCFMLLFGRDVDWYLKPFVVKVWKKNQINDSENDA